ncbi:hypothetical protein ACX0MV_17040 [Pseudomonas borbori]
MSYATVLSVRNTMIDKINIILTSILAVQILAKRGVCLCQILLDLPERGGDGTVCVAQATQG